MMFWHCGPVLPMFFSIGSYIYDAIFGTCLSGLDGSTGRADLGQGAENNGLAGQFGNIFVGCGAQGRYWTKALRLSQWIHHDSPYSLLPQNKTRSKTHDSWDEPRSSRSFCMFF